VTPKCLWFSTNFAFSLLKTIQGLLAAWLVDTIMHSVFFGLKSTIHSFDQLYILDRSELTINSISFILLEEYNNDVSSANSLEKL
jgi:hypothetical protein